MSAGQHRLFIGSNALRLEALQMGMNCHTSDVYYLCEVLSFYILFRFISIR